MNLLLCHLLKVICIKTCLKMKGYFIFLSCIYFRFCEKQGYFAGIFKFYLDK